jgi:hypothetical protein
MMSVPSSPAITVWALTERPGACRGPDPEAGNALSTMAAVPSGRQDRRALARYLSTCVLSGRRSGAEIPRRMPRHPEQ